MKIIIILISLIVSSASSSYKVDFGKKKDGQDWIVINDDVMGGRTSSTGTLGDNSMLLKGNLSLENNGGFASVRSPNGTFDLSKFSKVTIKYRSPGRKFAFRLLNYGAYYKPYFKHEFESSSNDWDVVELMFDDFQEYRLSEVSTNKISKQKLEDIIQIGFILSDKKSGPFEIEIDYIEFN